MRLTEAMLEEMKDLYGRMSEGTTVSILDFMEDVFIPWLQKQEVESFADFHWVENSATDLAIELIRYKFKPERFKEGEEILYEGLFQSKEALSVIAASMGYYMLGSLEVVEKHEYFASQGMSFDGDKFEQELQELLDSAPVEHPENNEDRTHE